MLNGWKDPAGSTVQNMQVYDTRCVFMWRLQFISLVFPCASEFLEVVIFFSLSSLQKTVEVHVGSDASLWRPLHHFQRDAVHRGVRDPLADPDAL